MEKSAIYFWSAAFAFCALSPIQLARASSSPNGLIQNLAACTGELAAAQNHAGSIEGFSRTIEVTEKALQFVDQAATLDRASVDRIRSEAGQKISDELLLDPMNARRRASDLREKCDAYVAQALSLFNEETAALKKKAEQEAEVKRQEKLRIEFEIAKAKAAEAEALRLSKQDAARQEEARLEIQRREKQETDRKESEAAKIAADQKRASEIEQRRSRRKNDTLYADNESMRTMKQSAGSRQIEACEETPDMGLSWLETIKRNPAKLQEQAETDLRALMQKSLGAKIYMGDVAASLMGDDINKRNDVIAKINGPDLSLECAAMAAALADLQRQEGAKSRVMLPDLQEVRDAAKTVGTKETDACEEAAGTVRGWLSAIRHGDFLLSQVMTRDVDDLRNSTKAAQQFANYFASQLTAGSQVRRDAIEAIKSPGLPAACIVIALKDKPITPAQTKIEVDYSDPYYGPLCAHWATQVRAWHNQNMPYSFMEEQAHSGTTNNLKLIGLLNSTMNEISKKNPQISVALNSNKWNEYCVATVTGRN